MPDDLDRQLDAALSRYSAVEPPAGLEQRTLARARRMRERKFPFVWAAAGAAAAIVLWLAPRPEPVKIRPPLAPPVIQAAAVPTRPSQALIAHRHKRKQKTPPPIPELTAEERALITLAQNPADAQEALAWRQKSAEPLAIEALSIRQLQTGALEN